MVRSRGGKTMGESSTGSSPSVRRTRRSSTEENTPLATPEKREKTKKSKKSLKVQENVIFIMKMLSLDCSFYG